MTCCDFVRGLVLVGATGAAAAGLTVRLGLRRDRQFKELARTKTGSNGRFKFDLAHINQAGERADTGNYRVEIYDGTTQLIATGTVSWPQTTDPGDLQICVAWPDTCAHDEPDKPVAGDNGKVYGRVQHESGQLLSHVGGVPAINTQARIELISLTFAGETSEAEIGVAADGTYAFTTTPASSNIMLVVRDAPKASSGKILKVTPVYYGCTFPKRIDLEVCDDRFRGKSEFERLDDALDASVSSIDVNTITADNVAFLVGTSGFGVRLVAAYVAARRVGGSLSVAPQAIYGLLRMGYPWNANAILARGVAGVPAALDRAACAGDIARSVADASADVVQALLAAREALLTSTTEAGALGAVFAAGGALTSTQQADILALLLSWEGSMDSFWDEVATLSSFTTTAVTRARTLVQFATLALNHAETVEAIVALKGADDVKAVARVTASEWTTIVAGLSTIPEGIEGDSDTERRTNYAALLKDNAEIAFPATAFHTAAKSYSGSTSTTGLVRDYCAAAGHENFDISTAVIDNLTDTVSVAQKAALKQHQRLYRVGPTTGRFDAAASLAANGVTSARAVAKTDKTTFVSSYAATMGSEDAALDVYRRARKMASMTSLFYSQAHPNLTSLGANFVVQGTPEAVEDVTNGAEIFTTTGYCVCSDCLTVLSASAYLVDLLSWVSENGGWYSAGGTVPSGYLNTRRPDLGLIDLSCDNTTRVLPYIDLVLEVLENAVSPPSATVAYSSQGSTEELLAAPEYVNDAAYTAIEGAYSHAKLPFHRPLAEMRVFLQHLGVARVDLMRAFQDTVSSTNVPTEANIAWEELGLSPTGVDLIVGSSIGGGTPLSESSFWPVASTGTYPTDVLNVRAFMRLADVDYPTLLDLLHTRYVDSTSALSIDVVTGGDACSLDSYQITVPTGAEDGYLSRFRRFTRLRRATGWSVLDLDKVIYGLEHATSGTPPTDIDTTMVTSLGYLHELARRLSLPPVELVSWWSKVDTWDDRDSKDDPEPSLWERVFLNPTLFSRTDLDAVDSGGEYTFPFRFKSDETDTIASVTSVAISTYQSEIQAALAIDAEDFSDLADELGGTSAVANWANLSTMYRWTSVARAHGLTVADALAISDLAGLDPTASGSVARSYLEEVEHVRAGGLSLVELIYIVAHTTDSQAEVMPTSDWMQETLGRMRDDLLALQQSLTYPSDPDGTTTRSLVESVILSSSTYSVDDVMDVISGASTESEATQLAILTSALTGYVSLSDANTKLIASGGTLAGVERFDWVNAQIGDALWNLRGADLAVARLATALGLDVATLTALRAYAFTALASGTADFAKVFLADAFLVVGAEAATAGEWDDLTSSDEAWTLLLILDKVARIIRGVGLDRDEQDWWFAASQATSVPFALLNPFALDVTVRTYSAATGSYASLRALCDVFALRARIPGSSPTFAELLGYLQTSDTAFISGLASRTSWTQSDLEDVKTAMNVPGLSGSAATLERFFDAVEIVRRVGAVGSVVAGWRVVDPTSADSAAVVLAARSRHTDASAWSKVARPLRDELRKAQRDALLAYLIADRNRGFDDSDDVYGEYLIDVDMNPEMLTSRIVQACSSVQLYVHRHLMGLELDMELTDDDREEWQWRKNYRVWEAARKVFLYPENWIEPELRDDKTPFFKLLEGELSQGDITDERVEQCVLDYLDRLLEVASLEVVAYYWEKESDVEGTTDVLHVFARTRGEPPVYYYRRWEDQSTWTPWEKVDCGVEGYHLAPIVYNRRLMLFWVTFAAAAAEEEDAIPDKWWEVRLVFSEYRDGKWGPKRMGTDSERASLESRLTVHYEDEASYRLRVEVDDDNNLTAILYHLKEASAFAFAWFTLNPCTYEIETTVDTSDDAVTSLTPTSSRMPRLSTDSTDTTLYTDILAPIDTTWSRLGFVTSSEGLDVYVADTDDAGEVTDTSPDTAEVLDTLDAASVVVPHQYRDFAAQAPFFFNSGERAYFVVPDDPAEDTSTAQAILSATPTSVGALALAGGFGVGTTDDTDTGGLISDQSDPDANPTSGYRMLASISSSKSEAEASYAAIEASLSMTEEPTSLLGATRGFSVFAFWHPYVCDFIKELRRHGVDGLYAPDVNGTAPDLYQQARADVDFKDTFAPTALVNEPYPEPDIDFSDGGAYAPYNWEVFFHIPFYVACRLLDDQRFSEAQRWLHFIFDPTSQSSGSVLTEACEAYWRVKPFLDPVSDPVTDWVSFTGADGDADAQADFEAQVDAWRDDPFNPHLLARLRPGTYQKTVVMKYLDNLIAWGDYLFTQFSMESVNEATNLYVFAHQLLGDRPDRIDPSTEVTTQTFNDLLALGLDDFSNALVELENGAPTVASTTTGTDGANTTPTVGEYAYFSVPYNSQLLKYWDTVEDRLFKIRNGMDIEGAKRSLPLFQPPIDPAMLVRAAAAGVDLGSVLSDLNAPLPFHRFSVLAPRAQALAGSVKALGQALLQALEKRDAEALALLRSTQEIAVLKEVRVTKERAIDEAHANLEASRKSKKSAEARRDYYDKLIQKGWLPQETKADRLNTDAAKIETTVGIVELIAGVLGIVPDFHSPPFVSVRVGGAMLSRVPGAIASAFRIAASTNRSNSAHLSTIAGYKRRAQDWKQQKKLAEKEIAQVEKQILAAEIRHAIAKKDLENHDLQVANAESVDEWMRSKYTNQELYDWMVSQVASLHFQAYELAVSVAKRAQACYQHELGRWDETYIQAVYWDSLRKGLLAGDRLGHDIERMDAGYLQNDRREYEITRHVSLAELDPVAVLRLREQGECYFDVPEALFDLDFPGHYFRRIQSVSVSIPAVTGPQSTVNATLTLETSRFRTDPTPGSSSTYPETPGSSGEDARFRYDYTAQSVAISGAQDDAGVFQLDLKDMRYLPFERKGVIGTWRLQLSGASATTPFKQFDWSTISDVVLRVRYTARDGGELLQSVAIAATATGLNAHVFGYDGSGASSDDGNVRAFLASRDFPDELYDAQNPATGATPTLDLSFDSGDFPYVLTGHTVSLSEVWLFVKGWTWSGTDPGALTTWGTTTGSQLTLNGGTPIDGPSLSVTNSSQTGLTIIKASGSLGGLPTSLKFESHEVDFGTNGTSDDVAVVFVYTVS